MTRLFPIDGAERANATELEAWWGRDQVRQWQRAESERANESDPRRGVLPDLKTGQLKPAFRYWLLARKVNGAVVEFGTERDGSLPSLIFITLYERWLRFVDGSDRMSPRHKNFRNTARGCFVPDDDNWQRIVITQGPVLIRQALMALRQHL